MNKFFILSLFTNTSSTSPYRNLNPAFFQELSFLQPSETLAAFPPDILMGTTFTLLFLHQRKAEISSLIQLHDPTTDAPQPTTGLHPDKSIVN